MPAYLIANVEIKDPDKIRQYLELNTSIVKKHGGKFLVRGGDFEVAEGDWNPKRLVIVEFESMDKIRAFYNSQDYQVPKELRQTGAYTDMVWVEGVKNET